MRAQSVCAAVALLSLVCFAAAAITESEGVRYARTALDDYVAAPDPHFAYEPIPNSSVSTAAVDVHYYTLTSLGWLNGTEVDRPIWTHLVAVIIPVNCSATRAPPGASCVAKTPFVYNTGGDNRVPDIDKDEDMYVGIQAATRIGAPAVVIKQVPNEPLKFACDPYHEHRSADAILGLSWWHFVKDPSQPDWIVLLPMTKAVVKAMDMAQVIVPQYTGVNVTDFVVSGASKRGWTAWLVAAVDPRVKAVVPLVLDALNLHAFAHRQWRFYGGWTFALEPMWKMNFTYNIDEPNTQALFRIMDPYFYLDRLTMPKLAVNAVGDEFQMPDDQRHWGHDTVGPMHFAMIKNADHTLATGIEEVLDSVSAFGAAVARDAVVPTVDWSIDNATGEITVVTSAPPTSVDIAVGDSAGGVSAGKRDFRWAAIGVKFCPIKFWGACLRIDLWETTQTGLLQVNATTYKATMPTPATGWRGFFIEVRFPNPVPGRDELIFTSPTSVIPLTEPFAPCSGHGCLGKLM
jgi:PhoPQ-activated pathogenicity-related protein